jgi:hypothetical protein
LLTLDNLGVVNALFKIYKNIIKKPALNYSSFCKLGQPWIVKTLCERNGCANNAWKIKFVLGKCAEHKWMKKFGLKDCSNKQDWLK